MKVVYIHQHFVTNEGTGGTRSYDVSKHLVRMGHRITMVCGTSWQSTFPRQPWWRLWKTYHIDGIKTVVCNAFYHNEMRVPGRIWSFMKFAFLATLATLRERHVDLIFATSTPLTVGIPARLAAGLKRRPYVFEVRDLWPEDLLAAGRLKPGLQYKIWEWLELFCYAKARRILLVSKGFHDRLLERGFSVERLETVLLGADSRLFERIEPDTEYLERNGLSGKIIAVYAGAYGDANGLTQILDAAGHLQDRADVALVMIGDGKMRPQLEARVRREQLNNVHLLPFVQKHELPAILAACHMGLMTLKQITRPRWVTPNKIFDYMFAGLPSIVNFDGTTAELVQAEGIGVATKPGCAEDLAAQIRHWADHPEERAQIGRRAREVAFAKFDRKMIAERLAMIFENCIAG